MELPVDRIIVDSRTATRGTASEFELSLPYTIVLPPETSCVVLDVSVSHSWYSVEGHATVGVPNHYIYWLERNWVSQDVTIMNRAALTSRNYTGSSLATEIATQMSAVSLFGSSAYTGTFDSTTNKLSITLSYTHPMQAFTTYPGFFILNEELLGDVRFQAYAAGRTKTGDMSTYTMDWYNPQACFGLIGFQRGASGLRSWELLEAELSGSPPFLLQQHTTQSVDVRSIHAMYLHCTELAHNVLGPSGSRSIISRIPVSSIFGGVSQHFHSGNLLDSVPCGGKQLSTLTFSIRDSYNNAIDLHGGSVSFTLLFVKRPGV